MQCSQSQSSHSPVPNCKKKIATICNLFKKFDFKKRGGRLEGQRNEEIRMDYRQKG